MKRRPLDGNAREAGTDTQFSEILSMMKRQRGWFVSQCTTRVAGGGDGIDIWRRVNLCSREGPGSTRLGVCRVPARRRSTASAAKKRPFGSDCRLTSKPFEAPLAARNNYARVLRVQSSSQTARQR